MQDQTAPVAARSYVTTLQMMTDQYTHLGYWKEKQVKTVGILPQFVIHGIRKIFQFHKNDGTTMNWFMHEYVPTGYWGTDLFMEVKIVRILAPEPLLCFVFIIPLRPRSLALIPSGFITGDQI